jgi:small GTP-binding protein
MPESVKKKVLLLGDGAVGKTSLIRRFVVDKFSDDYIATIGTKVTKKEMQLRHHGEDVYLTLVIWDILGQKEYRTIHETSFAGATGALVVGDLTRPETMDSLEEHWIPFLWSRVGKVPLVFAGNKTDLIESPRESERTLGDLASRYEAEGVMTSAKTGMGVEAAFRALGAAVVAAGRAVHLETAVPSASASGSLAQVADLIMTDFCKEFGGSETGMPVVRQQFRAAGVHVNDPTAEELRRAVELLAQVELSFRAPELVARNRERRLAMIRSARA